MQGSDTARARLFFGIPIPPDDAQRCLDQADLTGLAARSLRWVPEGHHHITLCYLGDTPRAEIPHLVKDVEAVRAALHPFVMTFQEVARFPQTQRSKVIAAMVEESEPLEALHQQLDTLLVQRGYPPDKHSHFVPHMTLLHDDGTQAYAPHTLKAFRVNVDRFVLYESKGAGEYLPLVPFTL